MEDAQWLGTLVLLEDLGAVLCGSSQPSVSAGTGKLLWELHTYIPVGKHSCTEIKWNKILLKAYLSLYNNVVRFDYFSLSSVPRIRWESFRFNLFCSLQPLKRRKMSLVPRNKCSTDDLIVFVVSCFPPSDQRNYMLFPFSNELISSSEALAASQPLKKVISTRSPF